MSGVPDPARGKKAGRNGQVPPEASRWKPGQSGNPEGRPKGRVGLMRLLRELLSEAVPGQAVTYGEVVARSVIKQGLKDPVKAWPMLREFIRRDEGPVGTDEEAAEPSQAEQERAWEEFGRYLRRLADPTGP